MKRVYFPTYGFLNSFKRVLNGSIAFLSACLRTTAFLLHIYKCLFIITLTKHSSGIPHRHRGFFILNQEKTWADPSIIVRLWSAATVALLMVSLLFFKQQNTVGAFMETAVQLLLKLEAQQLYLLEKLFSLEAKTSPNSFSNAERVRKSKTFSSIRASRKDFSQFALAEVSNGNL